jgi:predicted nucleic acid-binding protein
VTPVPVIAILDANVLYSAPMRDFFMRLTTGFLFQPKWTEQIHTEWIENVLEHRPDVSRTALERTRDLMNQYGNDWRVPEYQHLLSTLTLPDKDDCHVLAAAIAANAPIIVTFNLRDFPPLILQTHGIKAVSPDNFALSLLEAELERFLQAIRSHRQSLKSPPKSVEEYLETLFVCGLPKTVAYLREYSEYL